MLRCLGVTRDRPVMGGGSQAFLGPLFFTAAAGTVTAVIGPAACGKTLLSGLLTGVLSAKEGGVVLQSTHRSPVPWEGRVGFLGRGCSAPAVISLGEYLDRVATWSGRSPREAREVLLDRFGLDAETIWGVRGAEMDASEVLRAAMVRALWTDPEVVVVDDPLDTGVPRPQEEAVFEFLASCRKEGRATIFLTRQCRRAEGLCDHVLFLREGNVLAQGTVDELRHRAFAATLSECEAWFVAHGHEGGGA